ncbi:MAG: cytidine deaminase [Bacteroidetes bacterium]|jgi:cytidine deaminase|nr:cytidine deaminase [Bacteroidota bacterium]
MPKKISVTAEFEVFETKEELDPADKLLLDSAVKIMENAYAPYSGFLVGAAVLLENGQIVTGNNQENAAYPSGLCAERVAVFHASSQFPGVKPVAIAVSAKSSSQVLDRPVTPCGACRQSVSEYEVRFSSPIRIIMAGEKGPVYISKSVSDLLPLTFTSKHL